MQRAGQGQTLQGPASLLGRGQFFQENDLVQFAYLLLHFVTHPLTGVLPADIDGEVNQPRRERDPQSWGQDLFIIVRKK